MEIPYVVETRPDTGLTNGKLGIWLFLASEVMLFGVGFMVIKYIEYTAKFDHHYYPSTNTFLAIYFTLTGLHGLHVLGGMVVNSYFALFGKKMWDSKPDMLTNRVENAGLFWHFVDLVWIFLFPILYLL